MVLTPISLPLWGDRQTLAPTALCGRNVEFARVRHWEHACRVGVVAVTFHCSLSMRSFPGPFFTPDDPILKAAFLVTCVCFLLGFYDSVQQPYLLQAFPIGPWVPQLCTANQQPQLTNLLQLIAVNDLPDAPYFPTRAHQTCNENSLPSPQQEL